MQKPVAVPQVPLSATLDPLKKIAKVAIASRPTRHYREAAFQAYVYGIRDPALARS